MGSLGGLWTRALSPGPGFRKLAAEGPGLRGSVLRMLALRSPIAFLDLLFAYASFVRLYQAIVGVKGPLWDLVLLGLAGETSAEEIRGMMLGMPPVPTLGRALPWLLAAAPAYVASVWIHDVFWDHGCLWLLKGLGEKRGFRATLVADAEALQVGVFGAALGLLTALPRVGWLLSVPVGLVGAYFWILRGFSLAAFHGCPDWKGVAATILHVALALVFLLVFALLLVALVTWQV